MRLPLLAFLFALTRCLDGQAQGVVLVTNLNDSGPGSFRESVANAFPNDTVRFAVTGTLFLTSGPILYTKDLVIDGPGRELLHIDGGNQLVPLVVAGGSTWMDGLTILHGRNTTGGPPMGGGMYFGGDTLVMRDVEITQCTVGNSSTYITQGAGLAAWVVQKVRLIDCSFTHNTIHPDTTDVGDAFGAGVFLACPDVVLDHCTITGNTARALPPGAPTAKGGGLYATGSVRLKDCVVDGNKAIANTLGASTDAHAYGGALYLENGIMDIHGGSISHNTIRSTTDGVLGEATYHGTGLYVTQAALAIARVELDSNATQGPAFPWLCHCGGVSGEDASLDMAHCTLIGNDAPIGSGIYWNNNIGNTFADHHVSVDHVRVLNSAGGTVQRGAIDVIHASMLRVVDSEVSDNAGSGLHANVCDTVLVDRCLFHGNTGSGAYMDAPQISSLVNCTFDRNSADEGGAIQAWGGSMLVRNCTLMNDTATAGAPDGRELYLVSANATVHNTIIASSLFQPVNAIGLANGAVLTSAGGNICRDASGAAFLTQPTDLNSTNPQLGTFGQHGGFTRTWSLANNSICIDHGGADTLSMDQRGFLRDGTSDAGAFEFGAIDPQAINVAGISPDDTVCVNTEVTLSVEATSGVPLHYQWLFNGAPIAGADSAVYTTVMELDSSGDYTCLITTAHDTVLAGPVHITVELCEAIRTNVLTALHVWPLPATDELFVSAADNRMALLRLLDPTGREVLHARVNGPRAALTLSDLPGGLYVLLVMDRNGNPRSVPVMKR